MNWPKTLYKFTKVQGVITTYTFKNEQVVLINDEPTAQYISNYGQKYYITVHELAKYYTSLESCYIAWIESIEKFKQKVIKQFENKCGVNYFNIAFAKIVENHNKRRQDEME